MKAFQVKSFAKVNIGLKIVNQRNDGLHNIETVFQEIDLHDIITISKTSERGCAFNSNVSWLRNDSNNLCVKAYKQLSKRIQEGGVSIDLHKKIPSGSGLGGGSSNAASVLKGLCKLYDISLSDDELAKIALNIGSDVPFFIKGGMQSLRGVGSELLPLSGCINGFYLLAVPNIHIDTKWAYNSYGKNFFLDCATDEVNFASYLSKRTIPFELFENDFEKIVVPSYPEIGQIKERLQSYGSKFTSLSGTGSTVFGIFNDLDKAKSAKSLFANSVNTFIVNPIPSMF